MKNKKILYAPNVFNKKQGLYKDRVEAVLG